MNPLNEDWAGQFVFTVTDFRQPKMTGLR